jgi:hypothetical protein
LMLAAAIVAAIVWLDVMSSRRSQRLGRARQFRAQSVWYAQREQRRQLGVEGDVQKLAREVAAAEPPAAGSDAGAWKAHRECVDDVRASIKGLRQRLAEHERYGAIRRYFERLSARYEAAANTPWLNIEADLPPPE